MSSLSTAAYSPQEKIGERVGGCAQAVIYQTRESVSSGYPSTEKWVEKTWRKRM